MNSVALRAVEELEAHHVAGRYLTVDDVFIEGSAQFAADGARPHPGAGIGQVHLCGLSRAAELR